MLSIRPIDDQHPMYLEERISWHIIFCLHISQSKQDCEHIYKQLCIVYLDHQYYIMYNYGVPHGSLLRPPEHQVKAIAYLFASTTQATLLNCCLHCVAFSQIHTMHICRCACDIRYYKHNIIQNKNIKALIHNNQTVNKFLMTSCVSEGHWESMNILEYRLIPTCYCCENKLLNIYLYTILIPYLIAYYSLHSCETR